MLKPLGTVTLVGVLLLVGCGKSEEPTAPAAEDESAPAAAAPAAKAIGPQIEGDLRTVVLTNTCAGCHGTHGASAGAAPVIAGLNEGYFYETMKNYAENKRYSTIMGRIARGYTDEELKLISGHFANLPWVSAEQEIDAAMASKGEALHNEKGCVGCHGAEGVSAMPNVPRVAGQYAEYMVTTMKQYADPALPIPAAAMPMRGMLSGLSDDELMALAHYYGSKI